MKNCNSILSIHEGMGTTQNDRVKPALDVHFFLLEERNEQDFILFVQRLSKYVKFFNEFDTHEGDWSAFYQKESTAILIYLASWNIEILQQTFEIKKNEIYLNADFAIQKDILLTYFNQIESEYTSFLKSATLLDDVIIEKENLIASSYLITNKLVAIAALIEAANDIPALLKNYVFIKTTQQLFGLLLSWKNFSEKAIANQLENYSKHSPHYALFLAFLKLLQVAKDKVNEFTKQHLDFYYKDVLKIETKEAQPDYVHLVIEPFQTKPFLISKDTLFLGGKNTIGQKKYYAATQDVVINQIKLNSFLSYSRQANTFFTANKLLDVNGQNKSFDVFTNEKSVFKEGFMIASPILFLQSGERHIYLRFNGTNHKASDFDFYLTGEKGVVEVTQKSEIKDFLTNKKYLHLSIPATEKAILPFDAKLHEGFHVVTSFPVLKIIPKNKNVLTSLQSVDITIAVRNFKSYVLNSDFGSIDVEKAFYPFGEFPKNGNGMNLSSNEFFMKKNAIASLKVDTLLSDLGELIEDYVEIYTGKELKDWMEDKVTLFQLNNGKWEKETTSNLNKITNEYPLEEYHFDKIVTDTIVSNGKIRIQLNHTDYDGEKYMQRYIAASQDKTTLPYKPRIEEFVFNYTVSEKIDLTTDIKTANPISIFQVEPFGYTLKKNQKLRFATLQENQGHVYFGFEEVAPNDGLNFLIQLEEGTANPFLEPAALSWHYLSNNTWQVLEQNAIGDETYSLTQSGLVSITVPTFEATNNTTLAPNLFWLRLSISNTQAICKFLGVHVQAFKAVLTDFENSNAVFLEPTPKETISKAYKTLSGVKKIIQPYVSFNGVAAELDEHLYMRSSERLRHKDKAITTWDYERIILEAFPEVYRIKTLNHYRYDTKISNVAAGYVTLIPIAKTSLSDQINWKPLLSLNKMQRIKEYLYTKASSQVRINVKPPQLERVEVNFKVKYHVIAGVDTRLYTAQLMETINAYLSPWAYEVFDDINFADEIAFSSLIQLIDNQEYVDYITDFKVTQYQLDENGNITGSAIQNLAQIVPQSDFTLFAPTETHHIQEIK
ncbi:baseplate J/gp47 family protein [Flavobacterium sp.]|uniref:baseplate J/gp47 family protein n=1 Tax=Flavobacterium sp. TaxID=239 RepID=UPI0025BBDD6B|nr:baseplate J/gp47 family protein [Flavobacterium sp.]